MVGPPRVGKTAGVLIPQALMWAGALVSTSAKPDVLRATADPAVLRSCSGTDLDPERLLCTCSTLYVVSPSEHQQAMAPLITALIESIVNAAYDLHRQGRLPCRLLLSLDEVANIAPLPSLESIVSQGVLVCWAAQSLAQFRHRYGEHAAEAIWSATQARVVFGGLGERAPAPQPPVAEGRAAGAGVAAPAGGGPDGHPGASIARGEGSLAYGCGSARGGRGRAAGAAGGDRAGGLARGRPPAGGGGG